MNSLKQQLLKTTDQTPLDVSSHNALMIESSTSHVFPSTVHFLFACFYQMKSITDKHRGEDSVTFDPADIIIIR